MDDYILRKTAKKAMCNMCEGGAKLVCGTLNDCCTTMRIFDSIPAADVRPVVRGKWTNAIISAPNLYDHLGMTANIHGYVCSCCQDFSVAMYNFCPNCGADMREEN